MFSYYLQPSDATCLTACWIPLLYVKICHLCCHILILGRHAFVESNRPWTTKWCFLQEVLSWSILWLFRGLLGGKCCISGCAPLRSLSVGILLSTLRRQLLFISCSSVASGFLMLLSWKAMLCSRMRVMFKENVKNGSQQPGVFRINYNYGAKVFSHAVLMSQQNSTAYMPHKQQKPETLFLQDYCLLLMSAVVLMLLQPGPSSVHLNHFIASYLELLVGSGLFQLPCLMSR